jgi:hypothetical protein
MEKRMNTHSRSPWNRRLVFPVLVLAASGFVVTGGTQAETDPTREISTRFEGFRGPAQSVPLDQWEEYFLEPAGSGEISLGFDLDRVWVALGRLAWVQGKVDTVVGSERVSRSFAELMVRLRGEWTTVFSWVEKGSATAAPRQQARKGCSCRPCASCSSRGSR